MLALKAAAGEILSRALSMKCLAFYRAELPWIYVLSLIDRVLGRIHIAIPEQWSDMNLFRHNFADILSAPVHIEKSYKSDGN